MHNIWKVYCSRKYETQKSVITTTYKALGQIPPDSKFNTMRMSTGLKRFFFLENHDKKESRRVLN